MKVIWPENERLNEYGSEKRWEFVGFLFTMCCSVFIGWEANSWYSDPANREAPSISYREVTSEMEKIINETRAFRVTRTFRVTAYCPCEKCCGRFADGVTASGHVIKPGDRFVAASPEYTFGTIMEIPEYAAGKPVLVQDRGGAIKGNRLDVYFDTHQEALEWGVKILEVKL